MLMDGSGYTSNVRGFIIPGSAGVVAKAVFAPKDGHGANILTELCANTSVIQVRLSGNTNYLLTGDTEAFRQVILLTDIKEKNSQSFSELLRIGAPLENRNKVILNWFSLESNFSVADEV